MTEREHYETEGFYLAKGLFSVAEAAAIKASTLDVIAERGLNHAEAGLTVWMAADLDPRIQPWVCAPRLGALLKTLIGPTVDFLSVKPVFKDGRTTFGSPWHQDWFYWKGSPKISAWLALDPATPANGCLRVIPGSHRQLFALRDTTGENKFVHRVDESTLAGMNMCDVVMQPGDALCFHDRLLHASHPNTSGQDRWSLIPTYRNADVPDPATTWTTSLRLS